MKLSILLAALCATAVSALPTGNTNVKGVYDIIKNGTCRSTSLLWTVSKVQGKGDLYKNTFNYQIDYRNGQIGYHSSISVEVSSNSGGRWVCQNDGVWCVIYSGWAKSDKLTIQYAGVDLVHETPDLRPPKEDSLEDYAARDDYLYIDCVPW
ncbi:hypothetical protein EC991_005078 [Linnemannia zychae]|nr:hypothetical protein EC991_005078 [Linnemannia zychae]